MDVLRRSDGVEDRDWFIKLFEVDRFNGLREEVLTRVLGDTDDNLVGCCGVELPFSVVDNRLLSGFRGEVDSESLFNDCKSSASSADT